MKQLSYDARVQWASAVFLALVAGYLDGYGLLFLGTYVSFMSGNTTFAGLKSGQGNFQAALPSAVAIVFFVTGSFLGNLLTQSRLRYSHRLIFGVIAGLLATVAGLEWHGARNIPCEIVMLSSSCALPWQWVPIAHCSSMWAPRPRPWSPLPPPGSSSR